MEEILLQTAAQISVLPGSLFYHLVLLFALVVTTDIALNGWWRTRRAAAGPYDPRRAVLGRLVLATASLLFLRLALFGLDFLAAAQFIDALVILPPLDRAASTLSILMIIWAFAFPEPTRLADGLLLAAVVLLGVAYVIAVQSWADEIRNGAQVFNNTTQDIGWAISQMVLLALGLLLLILRRGQSAHWGIGVALLVTLLGGQAGHVFLFLPGNVNVAVMVRAAEILAMPMWTAMTYRRAQASMPPLAVPVPLSMPGTAHSQAAPSSYNINPKAAVALASLNTSASPAELGQIITLALAHAFQIEHCLLITPSSTEGLAQLLGGYDLGRDQFLPGGELELSGLPEIALALKRGKSTWLMPERNAGELRQLTAAARLDISGPARLVSLTTEDGRVQGVAAFLPAQLEWTTEDQSLLSALTEGMAATLDSAAQLRQLQTDLMQTKAQFEKARSALGVEQTTARQITAELDASQRQIAMLTNELALRQADVEEQRQEAERLIGQLRPYQQAEAGQVGLMSELNDLRVQLQAAQSKAEAQDLLRVELETASARLEGLAQIEAQLAAAHQRIEELSQQESQLQVEREAASARAEGLAQIEAQLAAAKEQAEERAQREGQLQEELTAARSRLEALRFVERQLSAATQQAEEYIQREKQLKAELETASTRLKAVTEIESQLAEARQRIEELAQREGQLQAERDAALAQAETLAQAQGQLQSASQQEQTLRAELEQFRARVTMADEALTAVQAKLASATVALSTAQQGHQQREAQLRRELEEARAELESLVEQPEANPGTLAAAEAALDEARTQMAAQAAALTALREQVASARTRPLTGPLSRERADLEVMASLVQELRQPMSSISGYTDLIMSESVGIIGALQRKFLERIKASIERMGALLDDLIHIAALDAGALQLAHENLDVTQIVQDAAQGCQAQFREKEIGLRLELADDLPLISADPEALRQILTNLLKNAGSASQMNTEVVLTVQHEVERPLVGPPINHLFLSVQDTGGGIAPEDQPRVFSRLYRADAPLVAGLGDTGVGLSMVKALVEAHSGRVWVMSDPGQGSTFFVLLPLEGVVNRPSNGSALN